jgi:membrane protease YdiL (CAAX protease family)
MKQNLPIQKEKMIMTTLFVCITLGLLYGLPESGSLDSTLQEIIASSIFLLVLPVIYCKMILKEPLSSIGLREARWLPAFFWGGVMIAVGGVLLFLLLPVEGFREAYRLPAFIEKSFKWFVVYEVLVVGGIALLYEVFFRGLVMKLWLGPFGPVAIVLQSALFIGFIGISSGFSWQYAVLCYASLFSGVVAYFSRSIYASWLANWALFFLVDLVFLVVH